MTHVGAVQTKNLKSVMGNKIIIALDGISVRKALSIAKKLKNRVWGFKINDLLFEPNVIPKLKKFSRVFADAKVHDIPSTAARIVTRLEQIGADLITVHASGGVSMMRAAKSAARRSKILGVTFLTSQESVNKKEFLKLIKDIKKAKLDGIVCSAHELKYLKNSKFFKIVPGVRPKWYKEKDDQSRKATPQEALKWGADFMVLGRPIIKSSDILKSLEKISSEF